MDTLPLPPIFQSFSRHPLLFPHLSPIETLENITRALTTSNPSNPNKSTTTTPPRNITISIKRDDCNSGIAFGGNKLRALEYIVPEILRDGYDVVVVEGGVQSNTVRLVCGVCARIGVEVLHLQRPGSKNWSEPSTPSYTSLGNIQITKLLSPSPSTSSSLETVLTDLTNAGRKPYHIPAGTSGIPAGGTGYARLAFEIIQQERARGLFFDTVVLASAGGGTAGGLVAGFRVAEGLGWGDRDGEGDEERGGSYRRKKGKRKRKIVSVFVGSDVWSLEGPLRRTEERTMELLCPKGDSSERNGDTDRFSSEPTKTAVPSDDDNPVELVMDFSYNAGGYGLVDGPTISAMKMVGSLEGVILDPVYTGKAFACLLGRIEKGEIEEESSVLFLHTGGQAVLSAYAHLEI